MGTVVSVDVRDAGVPGAAIDEALAWLHEADALFSTYRAGSAVSRLDAGTLDLAGAGPLVRAVLERCEALRAATGGAFDVRATGRLDPSGFVKGWAVQRAADLLAVAGAAHFMVNAGGDVALRGGPAPGERWAVGVQHPLRRDRVAAVLRVRDGAVATSGAYERGAHVVDPRTRRPPAGVLSVTVVGPDLGTADAYATAAFAMGPAGARWLASVEGYAGLVVTGDETVLTTPAIDAYR
ncbi:MAG TPA: FAD:protein FMN transferase [Solirubrobacteraceae bacterium]|nr:FAD:protein FMN transferase [Solirubrobacteraceae bacterium]